MYILIYSRLRGEIERAGRVRKPKKGVSTYFPRIWATLFFFRSSTFRADLCRRRLFPSFRAILHRKSSVNRVSGKGGSPSPSLARVTGTSLRPPLLLPSFSFSRKSYQMSIIAELILHRRACDGGAFSRKFSRRVWRISRKCEGAIRVRMHGTRDTAPRRINPLFRRTSLFPPITIDATLLSSECTHRELSSVSLFPLVQQVAECRSTERVRMERTRYNFSRISLVTLEKKWEFVERYLLLNLDSIPID